MKKLDINELNTVFEKDQTGRAMREYLKTRKRGARFGNTEIYRLAKDIGQPRELTAQKFVELQAAGVGQIIYQRDGKQPKFHWGVSLKKIADALEQPHAEQNEPMLRPESITIRTGNASIEFKAGTPIEEIVHIIKAGS